MAKIGSRTSKMQFSIYTYVWRNFQRRRVRYGLTVFGVAVCVCFFVVVASLTEGVRLELLGELEPDIRPDENTTEVERARIEADEFNRDIERTLLSWLYITSLMIFLTAIFLVGNTMMMSVLERRREVGILKSVGISITNIKRIFLVESLWVVFAGWTIGTFAGIHLSNNIFNYIFEAGESSIFFAPSRTPPVIILVALLIAVVVGITASIWPIRRVAKMSVMEALRI
jgi:ABC-type lipoprotein release transport system permease subunit